jgi:glycosyltransferase involved in cell wall biosynthesis
MPLQILCDRLNPADTSLAFRSAWVRALRQRLPDLIAAEGKPVGAGDVVLVCEDESLIARAGKRALVFRRPVWFWGQGGGEASRRFGPFAAEGMTATGFGVDLEHFQPVPPIAEYGLFLVLTVCQVKAHARVDQAIHAIAHLHETPECLLLHIGDSPTLTDFALLSDWRDLVAADDIQDQVEWRGPVPFAELPGFHASAGIHLDCSVSGPPPRELAEAMACGRPVLSSHPAWVMWLRTHGHAELTHDGEVNQIAGRIRWAQAQGAEALAARGAALRQLVVEEHGLARFASVIGDAWDRR